MKISEITIPLHELFTQPVPVVPLIQNNPLFRSYQFVVGGKNFVLDFEDNSYRGYPHVEVALRRLSDISQMSAFDTQKDFGGNPIQIYSTVASLIKDYLQEEKPEKLKFYGFDDKQQSLYVRMIPYMQKYAGPDYHVSLDAKDNISFDRVNASVAERQTQPIQGRSPG